MYSFPMWYFLVFRIGHLCLEICCFYRRYNVMYCQGKTLILFLGNIYIGFSIQVIHLDYIAWICINDLCTAKQTRSKNLLYT